METDLVNLNALTDSRLCLGTMLMGGKTLPAEAHAILDGFLEAGHNFIDTADVYGDGAAELTLKPWLAHRRDDVVITTKVRFPVTDPGGEGLAPERIRAACDASLRRLGIDTIDLYQIHGPDPTVPIEDVLETLDGLVSAGKVRALGVSNFPAWLLAWTLRTQDAEGWASFIALQAQYSLVERSAELELLPLCRSTGLRLTPWGPLGGGFLTGRHPRGGEPAPAAAWPTPPTAPKRRCTDAQPSATSAWSRRPAPSPPNSTPPSPRSPSPGSYTSPESAHRSSAPHDAPAPGPPARRHTGPQRRTPAPTRRSHATARRLPPSHARRPGRHRSRAEPETRQTSPDRHVNPATSSAGHQAWSTHHTHR